jgi:hypothetical protein
MKPNLSFYVGFVFLDFQDNMKEEDADKSCCVCYDTPPINASSCTRHVLCESCLKGMAQVQNQKQSNLVCPCCQQPLTVEVSSVLATQTPDSTVVCSLKGIYWLGVILWCMPYALFLMAIVGYSIEGETWVSFATIQWIDSMGSRWMCMCLPLIIVPPLLDRRFIDGT